MSKKVRTVSATLAVGLLLIPSAHAWSLGVRDPDIAPPVAAWTWELTSRAQSMPDGPGTVAVDAVACALGDINGDAAADLLVRVQQAGDPTPRLRALAGPELRSTLWELPVRPDRVLRCAPDLDHDGIADPILAHARAATSSGEPVADESTARVMQVLDGATGQVLLQRQHRDTIRSAQAGSASAHANATAELLPASVGAEALLKVEIEGSRASGVAEGGVSAEGREAAELQMLDARGAVVGSLVFDEPGLDPLALAPLPAGQGLPDVAALTARRVTPVEEASSRVPTLSRFHVDGSLAWEVELEPTQGLPLLVPRAGDLDLDGVQELIVQTVPTGVDPVPSSAYTVHSGLDGTALLDSGDPVEGLLAALPLGDVSPEGAHVLVVAQAQASGPVVLQAVRVDGRVDWRAELPTGSMPVNLRRDAYTGDLLGFTDLTGDGVPDVATVSEAAGKTTLQVTEGVAGAAAWRKELEGAPDVLPLSAQVEAEATVGINATATSDLLVVEASEAEAVLTLLDGASGEAVWRVQGALPEGVQDVTVDATAGGDLDQDAVQDVLVTIRARLSSSARMESIHALSGLEGTPLLSMPSDAGSGAAVELIAEAGTADAERAEAAAARDAPAKDTPNVAALAMLAALAVGLAAARRRR